MDIRSQEFQRLFEFSHDAVAITDKEGNILDVNKAFLITYGYTKEEIIGKNPRILKSHHSTREFYSEMWRQILDSKIGFWQGEIINLTKDKREIPVHLSINAIRGDDGEIKNFLGIAFDLTRRKKLEEIRKKYIDFIVHDLRGPLTLVMANAEFLKINLREVVADKLKKRLELISVNARRLDCMVKDMLDFSRFEEGIGLTPRKEKVDWRKIVEESILPFEGLPKEFFINGKPYPCEIGEVELNADGEMLRRIIYNLLSNAFKHSISKVELRYTIEGNHLLIDVTDDGEGIDAEDARHIFDTFVQTDRGVRMGGVGLGLSIVKSFVEAHGGFIDVETASGSGTRFYVRLPVVSRTLQESNI